MICRTDIQKAAEQEAISLHYQEKANLDARRQKRDGVVVTPTQVVDFQIRSTVAMVKQQYGRDPDEGIEWLDPFGGSGIYTARLLQIVDLSPERKATLASHCIVAEIDPVAAQICANNLAAVFREEIGYDGEIRVLNIDTFSLHPDADLWDEFFPVVHADFLKTAINKASFHIHPNKNPFRGDWRESLEARPVHPCAGKCPRFDKEACGTCLVGERA